MNPQIIRTIAFHANQLAKNFGLQAADKEDIRQELIVKALSIIEDFEEGEASLVTYIKRCLENKASDIARDLRKLPPTMNTDDASTAMDTQEQYRYSADRREEYVPFVVSMGGRLQSLSSCNHEHHVPLKMDIEAKLLILTPRQKEILEGLEEGKTQEQIAEKLGVTKQTINEQIMGIRTAFSEFENI